MKFSFQSDRKPAGVQNLRTGTILALACSLAACSGIGGTTYGTGTTQEEALISDLNNITNITDEQGEAIDYTARPGLVIPPSASNLPKPIDKQQTGRLLTASDWPRDPDLLRKAYLERLDTMNDKEREAFLAAVRSLPKAQRDAILKNDPRVTSFTRNIKEHDFAKDGPTSSGQAAEYSKQVKERLALINAVNDKNSAKRKYLTQPPSKYRTHDPKVKAEMEKISTGETQLDDKKKSGNALSRLWPF
ncbi:MAG: hypothetical protein N4A65_02815 [Cohaesibacter sp.]|nr:hypothetical protein [Cohaesibacter sp.]